jgi:Ser/Thr protein kinase RdoA (MazF antagonist)
MRESPVRTVTLVVVDAHGELRGQLPSFTVSTPWWQDLDPVVRTHPGLVILRLLHARPAPGQVMGGEVVYLVQADRLPSGLASFTGAVDWLADHPLRMPWARPGGPQADLEWAADRIRITGRPEQKRSWNLSSIWRLPTDDGPVWLKAVPPFCAHEGAVLEQLQVTKTVPTVLARDGHRLLMAELPGVDGYEAGTAMYCRIIDVLIEMQLHLRSSLAQLRAVVPDWGSTTLHERIETVVAARAPRRRGLRRLLDTWGQRMAALDECGLPEVLFHGDAHPGNARIGVDPPVIFDWGDSGIGHPLLDVSAVENYRGADPAETARLCAHWLGAWQDAIPGAEPGRAWRLLQPVAVARAAVVFQRFLENIEPSERVYHHLDIDPHLAAADKLLLGG